MQTEPGLDGLAEDELGVYLSWRPASIESAGVLSLLESAQS
jgi:hypothetical protein